MRELVGVSLTPEAIGARLTGVVPLSRQEAAEIAAHAGARPVLRAALANPAAVEQAALLLGEIGHPDDLEPLLKALLEAQDAPRQDVLLEALARLGEPALEPLAQLARFPRLELMRLRVAHGLASMACLHESTADRVAQLFIELVERPDLVEQEVAQLSLWLDVLDRREAFPVLERRLNGMPTSTYNEARLNEWKARPPGPHPDRLQFLQPFERFLAEHRAEYFRLLAELINQAAVLPGRLGTWRERFDADLAQLRAREVCVPDVGRNDPCPCGSGRKYKKCHLESDDETARLMGLVRAVAWPSVGHGMLPSEQWERLERDELRRHLEILALPSASERAERETGDYLLWSCAQNHILHGLWGPARELATLVAASQQGHPALNYDEIALVAQSTDRFISGGEPPLADLQFMLNSANFALAWENLRQAWWTDPEEGLRVYRTVLEARPGLLWTAAALAETARSCAPDRALPEVRAALKRAREGGSQPPPGLPEQACPVWVLEAYVQDLEVAVARSKQFEGLARRLLERPVEDKLSPGLELTRSRYQALDADLKRNLEEIPADQPARRQEVRKLSEERRLQLAFELGQHFQTVVASEAVAGASRPGEVLWVLPHKAQPGLQSQTFSWLSFVPYEGDSPIAHCANALGEVVRSSRARSAQLIPCTWRGFAAWLLRVDTDETELDEMARLIASDKLDCPFVDALWAPLERELKLSSAPDLEREGEPSLEEEPGELGLYLSRVLTRMLRHRKVGAAHTDKSLFVRGVPTRLRGQLKDLLEELIAQGYMREKPTVTGAHISLEPARLAEIKRFLAGEDGLPGISLA